jgi:hypothetical protein
MDFSMDCIISFKLNIDLISQCVYNVFKIMGHNTLKIDNISSPKIK